MITQNWYTSGFRKTDTLLIRHRSFRPTSMKREKFFLALSTKIFSVGLPLLRQLPLRPINPPLVGHQCVGWPSKIHIFFRKFILIMTQKLIAWCASNVKLLELVKSIWLKMRHKMCRYTNTERTTTETTVPKYCTERRKTYCTTLCLP